MSERYLDFREISKSITFAIFLDFFNIPYTKKNGELKGEINDFKFIVNIEKNLFFSPDDPTVKGSVINFLAEYKRIGLRQAAQELYGNFLQKPKPNVREVPELTLEYTKILEDFGISAETAKEYEVGLVNQRSIMGGRIAFKIYDEEGKVSGYVGWHPTKHDWLFPKSFTRTLYNVHNVIGNEIIVTVNLFDCLYLLSQGIQAVSSLIAKSMTTRQEESLKKYSRILLLHPEPENIINRLCPFVFVKAPKITKAIQDYSVEEIMMLFC